jgi:hypothetical protein
MKFAACCLLHAILSYSQSLKMMVICYSETQVGFNRLHKFIFGRCNSILTGLSATKEAVIVYGKVHMYHYCKISPETAKTICR